VLSGIFYGADNDSCAHAVSPGSATRKSMTNTTSLFWFSVCSNGAGDRYFKSWPHRDDRVVRCFLRRR